MDMGSPRPNDNNQGFNFGGNNNNQAKPPRNNEQNQCSICQETLQSGNVRALQCMHTFHSNCIDQWIQINPICPICRMRTN